MSNNFLSFDEWSIKHAGYFPAIYLYLSFIFTKSFTGSLYIFFIINIIHDIDEILENHCIVSFESGKNLMSKGEPIIDNVTGYDDMLGDIVSNKIGMFMMLFLIYKIDIIKISNSRNISKLNKFLFALPLFISHSVFIEYIESIIQKVFKTDINIVSWILLFLINLGFCKLLTVNYNLKS